MKVYFLKRFGMFLVVLAVITMISFILSGISEIDPAEAYVRMHRQTPTEADLEVVRKEMGLDKPVVDRYMIWLGSSNFNLDGTRFQGLSYSKYGV